MNKSSIALLALVALIAGFGVSWYLAQQRGVELEAGLWFGEQARALPEFELTDHAGKPLTRTELENQWSLLFFGFTHCPDVCPVGLQTLNNMLVAIDDDHVSSALRVYFVSVDPERDTPQVLRDYLSYFNPAFIGATAPMDELRVLTRSLGIAHSIANRVEGSSAYDVEHSGAIVLVDPQARYAGLFSSPQDALAMARDMTRIVEYN